jgi:hypothetical protein
MAETPASLGSHGVEAAKQIGDAVSIGVAIATVADWLPALAALLTIVWTTIRICETKTMQRWLGRRRD